MVRGWLCSLAGWGLVAVPLSAAGSVEIETETGEDGQSCRVYQYDYRNLADQRESEAVSSALAESQGKAIGQIRYDSRDVFDESDPAENNWFYRGLNHLHITTQDPILASQLLFTEGDSFSASQMRESERLLRSRGYLTSAFILPERVCDDSLDLLVVTQDSWVTEPEVTFSREGGETRTSFGLKDGNFLGTGDAVSINYAQELERNSLSYEYSTQHFMQSRWATRVYFAQKSDGEDKAFSLERPFYALNVPWAGGGLVEDISEVRTIRQGGEDINEFRHRNRDSELYFGLAARADEEFTRRWLVGVTREEDAFTPTDLTVQGVPQDRRGSYAWVGMEVIENNFATYRNLNQIQRTEDVALGVNYSLRVGYGASDIGDGGDLVRYRADYSNVIGVGEHHILQLNAHMNARHYDIEQRIDTGVLGVEVAYNVLQDPNNRWYVRAAYDVGRNLEQYEELTLGGANGLRGYPIDYQRGERRYVVNVERRYFSNLHLWNLIRMGGVLYFDAGRAWDAEGSTERNRHLSNVGIGLRFSSSKARVGNILHIDLATPLAEKQGGDSVQVLIKAERSF